MTTVPSGNRLAVMVAGLGPLGAIFIASCLLMRKGILSSSVMTTQSGRTADLSGWVFGGWDIFPDDLADVVGTFGMVGPARFEAVAEELRQIVPMPAIFYPECVPGINGTHVKHPPRKRRAVEILMRNMHGFVEGNGCSRGIVVWCGSTETISVAGPEHETPAAFEAALDENSAAISNSQMYAWAAVKLGMPFASGSSNGCLSPALLALAEETGAPVAGEVFGQWQFTSPIPAGWTDYIEEEPWNPPATRDPLIYQGALEVRARMRIGESRRTAPAIAGVVERLDLAHRAGNAGLQTFAAGVFKEFTVHEAKREIWRKFPTT